MLDVFIGNKMDAPVRVPRPRKDCHIFHNTGLARDGQPSFLLIVGVQCRQFQVYPVHAAKGAKPSWCLHFPQEGSLERLLEVDFRMRLHKQTTGGL
jgi:hypothetical protein